MQTDWFQSQQLSQLCNLTAHVHFVSDYLMFLFHFHWRHPPPFLPYIRQLFAYDVYTHCVSKSAHFIF